MLVEFLRAEVTVERVVVDAEAFQVEGQYRRSLFDPEILRRHSFRLAAGFTSTLVHVNG